MSTTSWGSWWPSSEGRLQSGPERATSLPTTWGSTRVVTAEDQSVLTRHDYLPFGEEIGAALGNRNQASGVSGYTASLADGPAQKFTGKERDNESGLDYFQARYFSGAGGRFTTVDPALAISLKDPQTWNRYVYVNNRPLTYVDPDGLWPTHIHNQLIAEAFPGLSRAQRRILRRASKTSDFPYSRAKHHPIHYTRNRATPGDEAREDSEWYMHLKEKEARDLQTGDLDDLVQLSSESLMEFGRLLHAVTDRTSPAHRQPDGNPAVFEWLWYWWDHRPKEEKISEEEKRRTIREMHFAFEQVYGRKMLMRALAIPVPTRFVWEEVEVTLIY